MNCLSGKIDNWRKNLRAANSINSAASYLAVAVKDIFTCSGAMVFVLDISHENLVLYGVSGQEEQGFEDCRIPTACLDDPLSLCLLRDSDIAYCPNGTDNFPSVRLAQIFVEHRSGMIFIAKPLKEPGGGIIGAILVIGSTLADDFRYQMDLFCDYGAAVLSAAIRDGSYKQQTKRIMDQLDELSSARALKEEQSLGLIGASPQMSQVRKMIVKAAASQATVLLTGETGTGKEVAAIAIHQCSPRCEKPFIKIDCAALSPQLLESELFGYRKGSFTGANQDQPGLLRSAEGGTVLFDEIGEMPVELQSKLLRLIQEREVRPVGDTKTYKIDVRFLAATNRDIEAEINNQRFRRDLYHRLAVFPIHLPPLRERREDIPYLVNHFLKIYGRRHKRNVFSLSREAYDFVYQKDYDGNVRQLEAVIERAVLLSSSGSSTLELDMFEQDSHSSNGLSLSERLGIYEQKLIEEALRHSGGNRGKAALRLGIPRRTFDYKIKKINI